MGGACSQKLKSRRGLPSSSGRFCIGWDAASASKNLHHLAFNLWARFATAGDGSNLGWVISAKRPSPGPMRYQSRQTANTRAVDPSLQKRMEQFSLRQLTQSGLSRDTVIQARRGARVHPDSRARLKETVNELERQLGIRNSSQHPRMGYRVKWRCFTIYCDRFQITDISGGDKTLQSPARSLLIVAIDRNRQCIRLTGSSVCRTSPENIATPKSVAPPEHIEACSATAAP